MNIKEKELINKYYEKAIKEVFEIAKTDIKTRVFIENKLKNLPLCESMFLRVHFELDALWSMDDLINGLGVTSERMEQIRHKALNGIFGPMRRKEFMKTLDNFRGRTR